MRLKPQIQALAAGALLILLCTPSYSQSNSQPIPQIDAKAVVDQAATPAFADSDPWEGYNRAMFSFNDGLDSYTLKPLAKGYRAITPDPVESGVSNVYDNILEIGNIINDVLQWKWGQASNDTGRFLVNSTLGVLGIFDVAKQMGMPKNEGEDFGQTAAKWGSGQGRYIVLPFFGPSTTRDTLTLPLDILASPIGQLDHVRTRNTLTGARYLSSRADLLEVEKLISGDRYIFVRDAYLQRRDYLIQDGDIVDDFGSDDTDFSDDAEF